MVFILHDELLIKGMNHKATYFIANITSTHSVKKSKTLTARLKLVQLPTKYNKKQLNGTHSFSYSQRYSRTFTPIGHKLSTRYQNLR